MERRPKDIIIREVVEGFRGSRDWAEKLFSLYCDSLHLYPHGVNEEIDVDYSGPDVDPVSGKINYHVAVVVGRKYPQWVLDAIITKRSDL